jgi:hypothetical protein
MIKRLARPLVEQEAVRLDAQVKIADAIQGRLTVLTGRTGRARARAARFLTWAAILGWWLARCADQRVLGFG